MSAAPGQTSVDVGLASYNGQQAVGIGFLSRSVNGRFNVNGGLATGLGNGAKPVVRLGMGWVFDR